MQNARCPRGPGETAATARTASTSIDPLRIHYSERDPQRQVKATSGRWDTSKKLWFAPEEYVKRLGLMKRIVR